MLHPNAKQRLRRVLPTEYEVGWKHPTTKNYRTTTVTPDIRWSHDDIPMAGDYPIIALELSPEAMPRYANGDEVGEVTRKEEKPNDNTIAYIKYSGKPMYAELNITIAVDSSIDGIPAHVVADSMAHDVYGEYQFNTEHLKKQGTDDVGQEIDYEWPMAVSHETGQGITNMNRWVDEQSVQRRVMTFRVDYRFWRVEEVEALESITYEIGVDINHDMEITEEDGEQWWGPYYVDVGPYEDTS